jgi:hypothetical protein
MYSPINLGSLSLTLWTKSTAANVETLGRMTCVRYTTTTRQRETVQAHVTHRKPHGLLSFRCHAQTRSVWTEESRRLHSKRECVFVF